MATQIEVTPDGSLNIRVENGHNPIMLGEVEETDGPPFEATDATEKIDPEVYERARLADALAQTDDPVAHVIADVEEGLGIAARYRSDPLESKGRYGHRFNRNKAQFDEARDRAVEEARNPNEEPREGGWNSAGNPRVQWRFVDGMLQTRAMPGLDMERTLMEDGEGLDKALAIGKIPSTDRRLDRVEELLREVVSTVTRLVQSDIKRQVIPTPPLGAKDPDPISPKMVETIRKIGEDAVDKLGVPAVVFTPAPADDEPTFRPRFIGNIDYRPTEEEMKEANAVGIAMVQARAENQEEAGGLLRASELLRMAGCRWNPGFWDNKVSVIQLVVRWAVRTIDGEDVPWPETLNIAGINTPRQFPTLEELAPPQVVWLRRLGFDAAGSQDVIYADVPASDAHIEITRFRDLVRERGWDDTHIKSEIHPYNDEEDDDGLPKPHMALFSWMPAEEIWPDEDEDKTKHRNRERPPARQKPLGKPQGK